MIDLIDINKQECVYCSNKPLNVSSVSPLWKTTLCIHPSCTGGCARHGSTKRIRSQTPHSHGAAIRWHFCISAYSLDLDAALDSTTPPFTYINNNAIDGRTEEPCTNSFTRDVTVFDSTGFLVPEALPGARALTYHLPDVHVTAGIGTSRWQLLLLLVSSVLWAHVTLDLPSPSPFADRARHARESSWTNPPHELRMAEFMNRSVNGQSANHEVGAFTMTLNQGGCTEVQKWDVSGSAKFNILHKAIARSSKLNPLFPVLRVELRGVWWRRRRWQNRSTWTTWSSADANSSHLLLLGLLTFRFHLKTIKTVTSTVCICEPQIYIPSFFPCTDCCMAIWASASPTPISPCILKRNFGTFQLPVDVPKCLPFTKLVTSAKRPLELESSIPGIAQYAKTVNNTETWTSSNSTYECARECCTVER